MTWTPRNRSEDEEEEENIDLEKNDEDEPQKLEEKGEPEAPETGRGGGRGCRGKDPGDRECWGSGGSEGISPPTGGGKGRG